MCFYKYVLEERFKIKRTLYPDSSQIPRTISSAVSRTLSLIQIIQESFFLLKKRTSANGYNRKSDFLKEPAQ